MLRLRGRIAIFLLAALAILTLSQTVWAWNWPSSPVPAAPVRRLPPVRLSQLPERPPVLPERVPPQIPPRVFGDQVLPELPPPSPDVPEQVPALEVEAEEDDDEEEEDLEGVTERLKELEEKWAEFEEGLEEEEAEALERPSMKITGRIHLDGWTFPESSPGIGYFEDEDSGADPEDRLFFRRIRIGFAGEAFHTMLYKLEVDFNEPANPELKDMYIGWQELPVLQTVLVGNQKRPLGLDHLNSSRYNIFIERPLVIEAFNEDARRPGIQSYGVSDDESYAWQYGVFLLENLAETGAVIGDSAQGSVNGRLTRNWYDEPSGGRYWTHLGIAGMVARPDGDVFDEDSNANLGRFRTRSEIRSSSRWLDTGPIPGAQWYEILGLESMYNYGPLHFVGEYQTTWLQRDSTTVGTGPDLYFHGGYAQVAYFLTGEHMTYDRESGTIDRVIPFENFFLVDTPGGVCSGWGAWQAALRYSYLDLTDQDIAGGIGSNWTAGLVWYFNPYSSLQFNAVYGEIEEHEPVGGFTQGDFTALGARLRIDF